MVDIVNHMRANSKTSKMWLIATLLNPFKRNVCYSAAICSFELYHRNFIILAKVHNFGKQVETCDTKIPIEIKLFITETSTIA